MRYGFRHDPAAVPRAGALLYRARLRYYTADGHAIPGEGETAASADSGTSIDADQPGWVHATLRMG